MCCRYDDLRKYFDRVVVISLDRRPDRWRKFLAQLSADWPFGPPLRFPAVDGSRVEKPVWWNQGDGAWGCYLSHRQILKDCLDEGVDSVLILEDDAVFLEHFGKHVREFLTHLPEDDGLLYLGGQHIELHAGIPQRINDWVYRPYNVNRMHAYAIRGRDMLRQVYHHVDNTGDWTALHHIDHHMADLQKSIESGVYVPRRWLVAQGDGASDINGKQLGFRKFRDAEDLARPVVSLPMVAVMGPFSGGTSAVSGVLHRLGIPMGSSFGHSDRTNWQGHYEARELGQFCRKMFEEPWMTEKVDRETRIRLLKIWAAGHCRAFQGRCTRLGGKHPSFCFMGPELQEAWNDPVFVSVERDPAEVANSLARRDWGWPLEACMTISRQLIAAKEQFLATTSAPIIRLPYKELLRHPREAVLRLSSWLGISSSPEAMEDAIHFVNRQSSKPVQDTDSVTRPSAPQRPRGKGSHLLSPSR